MTQRLGDEFERQASALCRQLGIAIAIAGALALGGWAFDVALLKSLLPGLATMKANTALGFVLAGISLYLSATPRGTMMSRPRAGLARLLAVLVGAIGLLTLSEYGFGWQLGIDQLLFVENVPGLAAAFPGRMPPMSAMNFTLLAAALLLIDAETAGGARPSNWIALLIAVNSFLAVLGYLYGVDALYRVAALTAVALPTAILFLVASIGLAGARPDSSFVRQITADGAAGLINRRLLPAAILVPPFIGWLRWQGQLAGYYSTAFGLALFAMSNVAIFAALVWWSARALQRIHEQRAAVTRASDWQQAILNSAELTVISTDTQGLIRTINATAANLLGYAPEELIDRHTPALIHDPAEVAARAQVLAKELGTAIEPGFEVFVAKARRGGSEENDWTYVRKDGSRFPVQLSVTALTDGDGRLTGFLGIGKDISAQRMAELALRDSEQRVARSEARLRLITDNVPALISYIDHERRFRFNNAMYAQWLGRPIEEITGRRLDEVYDAPLCALIEPHLDAAFKGAIVNFEFASPKSGRAFRGTYIPAFDSGNEVIGVYGLINDITAQKEVETRLRQLTQTDSLTGLPNRDCFEEKLAKAIAHSERTGEAMALMFLDIDHFKAINDSGGHAGGDQALQEFARRLRDSVRPGDTVARLAGDEFVIILEPLKRHGDASVVAGKIIAAMRPPFRILDQERVVTSSVGIAVRRDGEVDAEALLRRADAALYRVKEAGRGGWLVEA